MCHIGTFTVAYSSYDSLFVNLMLEYIQYPWQRDIEARICNLFNVDYISSGEKEEQEEDGEQEGHHLPGPPVQEVRPGDHLGEKSSLLNLKIVTYILSFAVVEGAEDDQDADHHKYKG